MSDEDDSQPVDNAAHSVDDAAQSVKNAAQSVEDVAKKVENEEETKWYKKISTDVFVGVLIAFIVCVLRLNH